MQHAISSSDRQERWLLPLQQGGYQKNNCRLLKQGLPAQSITWPPQQVYQTQYHPQPAQSAQLSHNPSQGPLQYLSTYRCTTNSPSTTNPNISPSIISHTSSMPLVKETRWQLWTSLRPCRAAGTNTGGTTRTTTIMARGSKLWSNHWKYRTTPWSEVS